jgi:hypothetical protein
MTEAGLVIPENRSVVVSMMSKDLKGIENQVIPFSDLSVEPFIGEEKNVLYTKVQRDSSFVRVPIQKSMIVERMLMKRQAKQPTSFSAYASEGWNSLLPMLISLWREMLFM